MFEDELTNINTYISGEVPVQEVTLAQIANTLKTTSATDGKYFILRVANTASNTFKQLYHARANASATENKEGIYFD